MTSAKELAAALSVDPESVALCGEGGFDPGRRFLFVSRRYRHQWRLCHRAGAGAWEGVLMNPPINFARDSNAGPLFRFWLLMFVAPLLLAVGITLILRLTSNAEARVNAVLLQAEQQLAHSLDNETTFAGTPAVTRTAFATSAPATIYPRLAICAGSTGGAFTRTCPADNDKLAAGNAGDQGADNKHYRVKRTRNVTTPGCFFSSQSAGPRSRMRRDAGNLSIS